MGKRLLKNKNWICVIVSLAVFALVFVALHDMQTAVGAGLYLSIKAGATERIMYDLFVDGAMLVAIVLLVGVPCVLQKHGKPDSFLRLFFVFLAFMPRLGPGYCITFFENKSLFELRPAFREGSFMVGLLEGAEFSASLLEMVVPMFCLLLLAVFIQGKCAVKRWYFIALIPGLLMELGVFLFPNLAEFLCFGVTYCILLIMFDLWENLVESYEGMNTWGWILFGGLGLRGVYRLLDLMSHFHM